MVELSNSYGECHSGAKAHFPDVMRFRCPPPPAVKTVAARQMMSASTYVRQAVRERLQRDGVVLPEAAA
jgi:hypothetical protein